MLVTIGRFASELNRCMIIQTDCNLAGKISRRALGNAHKGPRENELRGNRFPFVARDRVSGKVPLDPIA
jgi:hypothetical protein